MPKQKEAILQKYKNLNTQYIDKKLINEGIQIITIQDSLYPKLLKQIANPPYILYLKGKIPEKPCFAVIGSRKISNYGKKCIQMLIPEL
jgi:DNA processing protein